MENFADLYSDYLICSTSYTTATGMSSLLNIKHDKVTQELSKRDYDSKFLWQRVKPYGRVGKSLAAKASHRTVRETLASYGSYHTNHFLKRIAIDKTLLDS